MGSSIVFKPAGNALQKSNEKTLLFANHARNKVKLKRNRNIVCPCG